MTPPARLRWTRRRAAGPVMLAAVLLLHGCAAADVRSAPATTATDELAVGLTEWSIETAGGQLLPGTAELVVTNTGATGHDLVVHGSRGSWATPVLSPGEQHVLAVRTAPGEQLRLVCTVVGHESAGMHTRLPVQEEPAP